MATEKTVLCIEDNISNMTLVARIVEAEGHRLIRAEDGPLGLETLSRERPDIILLDINIPGIDGLTLARLIKDDEAIANIPVIATTANVLVGDRERCLEAGVSDYLSKPVGLKELHQVIQSWLQRN